MFIRLAKKYYKSFRPFRPAAPIEDRAAWNGLDENLKRKLIQNVETLQPAAWSQILATDFLEFSRSGNRQRFEEKQFSRRTMLNSFVLAECAEYQGRFLDDILNGIYLICEETAWQLPPHNSYVRDTPQLPLPDVTRPVLDLFSAETGAVLAAVRYLMKSAPGDCGSFVTGMIDQELERRIFTPYLQEHFWWMGDGVSHMNNWTVWCTQNVLLAAAFCELPEEQMRKIMLKACQSIDYFLDEYGEDGCCDEGAQYFRHAGLCLFGCMEILNEITGGWFGELYQVPKIRNIASYIRSVHVAGPYYINFSDCSPVAGRCNAREYLFGKRTGQPELMDFAAEDFRSSEDPLLTSEHNLYYRLLSVFYAQEMRSFRLEAPAPTPDCWYPSVGLLVARKGTFCLAVKAGDNDDSHNHNDTGSFTVYRDGKPLFVDIGVETYQKKTFSPRRYEIWTMQSQYHNLPTFYEVGDGRGASADASDAGDADGAGLLSGGGIMQQAGPQYAAKDIACRMEPEITRIRMDLSDAYSDERVRAYVRTVTLENGCLTVEDRADCKPLVPVLSLITSAMPVWEEHAGILVIGKDMTEADAPAECTGLPAADPAASQVPAATAVRITGAASVQIERLPITDARLQTAWKQDLWRTQVVFAKDVVKLQITGNPCYPLSSCL